MSNNTLTFAMGGRIEIEQFQRGITQFQRLIAALTTNTGVKWVIEDLQTGSAVTTLRGESEDDAKIEKIVQAYNDIGEALELSEPLRYCPQVNQAVERIKSLTKSVEYIRFETPTGDHTVHSNLGTPQHRTISTSIGAISGRVQTLSNRGSLRFNLYDTIHDKAVACYLQPGQEELMREVWGRLARVSGTVSRETNSGQPVTIRQILNIEIIEDAAPGSYRLARGAVPWQQGDKMPEDIIRQLRDA